MFEYAIKDLIFLRNISELTFRDGGPEKEEARLKRIDLGLAIEFLQREKKRKENNEPE